MVFNYIHYIISMIKLQELFVMAYLYILCLIRCGCRVLFIFAGIYFVDCFLFACSTLRMSVLDQLPSVYPDIIGDTVQDEKFDEQQTNYQHSQQTGALLQPHCFGSLRNRSKIHCHLSVKYLFYARE